MTGPDAAIDALDVHLAGAVERAEGRLAGELAPTRAHPSDPIAIAREQLVSPAPSPAALATRTLLHAPPHRVIVRPTTPAVRRR